MGKITFGTSGPRTGFGKLAQSASGTNVRSFVHPLSLKVLHG
jgi:hypothetical protein